MSISQSLAQSLANVSVITVLAGAGVAKMKYFNFDGYVFSPLFLAGMADDIRSNYLHVKTELSADGSSSYSSTSNTLYLNFAGASTIEQKGMIVHETTHAMFDFQGKKMDIQTSEALAYIAQCMYVKLNGNYGENRLAKMNNKGEALAGDEVFEIGWEIAEKILAGKDAVFSVDSADANRMKIAVSMHPFYRTNYRDSANFDGYRKD